MVNILANSFEIHEVKGDKKSNDRATEQKLFQEAVGLRTVSRYQMGEEGEEGHVHCSALQ